MYSETFYKIGGALQFLTTVIFVVSVFINDGNHSIRYSNGLTLMYLIFLVNASFMNLLIARSGMPIGQYRSFILINIGTWGLAFLASIFYLSLTFINMHGLILLAFLLAIFVKPKFE